MNIETIIAIGSAALAVVGPIVVWLSAEGRAKGREEIMDKVTTEKITEVTTRVHRLAGSVQALELKEAVASTKMTIVAEAINNLKVELREDMDRGFANIAEIIKAHRSGENTGTHRRSRDDNG